MFRHLTLSNPNRSLRNLPKPNSQKCAEQPCNYNNGASLQKPVHDAYKQICWKGKQEKYAGAYRAGVDELQKIRRYIDEALKADAPQRTQTKRRDHDMDR